MDSKHSLVISAVGDDRPGIVGELTRHLHDAKANIADSRMINLRGQFAILLLVEGTVEALTSLESTLAAKATALGLRLSMSPHHDNKPREGVPMRLRTYSLDRPGIVHQISAALQRQGVNIEELETKLESAAFAGSPIFTMEMRLTVPAPLSLKQLRRELEVICDELNCDLDLDPV
jgi:glycine cleavage system transcriptional repressor